MPTTGSHKSSRNHSMSMLSSHSAGTTTTVSKSAHDDFSARTPFRTACVIIDEHVMYVNPGWLAELSKYFASKFSGVNANNDLILTDEVKYEEFLELMRVSTYCPVRKPITVANASVLLKMAHQFEMKSVMDHCEKVIRHNVEALDRTRLLQLACAMAKCDRHSSTMMMLIDKLSEMKHEELSALHFSQTVLKIPGDVVADVFTARIKKREMKRKKWCCFA